MYNDKIDKIEFKEASGYIIPKDLSFCCIKILNNFMCSEYVYLFNACETSSRMLKLYSTNLYIDMVNEIVVYSGRPLFINLKVCDLGELLDYLNLSQASLYLNLEQCYLFNKNVRFIKEDCSVIGKLLNEGQDRYDVLKNLSRIDALYKDLSNKLILSLREYMFLFDERVHRRHSADSRSFSKSNLNGLFYFLRSVKMEYQLMYLHRNGHVIDKFIDNLGIKENPVRHIAKESIDYMIRNKKELFIDTDSLSLFCEDMVDLENIIKRLEKKNE